jgi:hypothetical protein
MLTMGVSEATVTAWGEAEVAGDATWLLEAVQGMEHMHACGPRPRRRNGAVAAIRTMETDGDGQGSHRGSMATERRRRRSGGVSRCTGWLVGWADLPGATHAAKVSLATKTGSAPFVADATEETRRWHMMLRMRRVSTETHALESGAAAWSKTRASCG